MLLATALCGALAAPSLADDRAAPPPAKHPPEVTPRAQRAIERGLAYLVRTQNADGSWRTHGPTGNYPVAMTSLAGLAVMAGGNTPTQGEHARCVSRALSYVLRSARRDGLIAQLEEESHCMHGHGFALLFLAQCLGVEEDAQRLAQIKLALRRGIELTARSQSAAGGWLYTPDSGGDEGSVTVTQVQGLRAARNVGMAVPKRVIDGAMQYLADSTNPDGGIRYQAGDPGQSRPAITAAAVVCYYNAGEYDSPRASKALAFAERHLAPQRADDSQHFGHYYYGQMYMAQAMYLSGEGKWRDYYPTMRDLLVDWQDDEGWWIGDHVGPVYGTAAALLILQLPYKSLPIMQR